MSKALKHTPFGYFMYFYEFLGVKFVFNIFLSVLLGLFDGVGLALFIPLLQFVGDEGGKVESSSMGGMRFVIDGFNQLGMPLSIFSVLTLILIIFFLKAVLTYFLAMEQVDLRQKYGVGLRIKQLKDLKNLSYKGFLELDAGRVQNVMTAEISRTIQAMNQFMGSMKTMVILLSYVLMAFLANWQFAILIIIGGVISNFLFKKINENVKNASILVSSRSGFFAGYLIQSINTFKYLKSTNYFSRYYLKLEKVTKDVEVLNRKIGKYQTISVSAREPVIILIVVAVILFQVYVMHSQIGSIILSLLLFFRALTGLMTLQNSWQIFMQNVGAIQNLNDFHLLMKKYKENHSTGLPYKGFSDKINLKNINFSYSERNILENIDLEIKKNQTIAFVGESGSGKTTLANILITLLEPKNGEYLVDNLPVERYNLDEYRETIGYITQEPIIYTDSIYNNVTFWAEKTRENIEKFWNIINKVALADFVSNSDDKEDTQIGDNGIKISGGQKQRISIARELYKNIEILVMDEATSALDSETENIIHHSINEIKGQYTIIIIAHRLSTIKDADKICILESGSISAVGSFQELQNSHPRFRKMVELQNITN